MIHHIANIALTPSIMRTASNLVSDEISLPFGLPGAPEIEEFVGREAELSEIQEAFGIDSSRRRIVILHGLGGIGKTQLAVSYAKQHRDDYPVILWLNGKDEDTLKTSFAGAAQRLYDEHPSSSALKAILESTTYSDIAKAIIRWLGLRRHNRWLLIFDNVDDPMLPGSEGGTYNLKSYVPSTDHGHILITTRSSRLTMGKMVAIRKLSDINQSIQILTYTSGRRGSTEGKSILSSSLCGLTILQILL